MSETVTIIYITRNGEEYPVLIPQELKQMLWKIIHPSDDLKHKVYCDGHDHPHGLDAICTIAAGHQFPYHIDCHCGSPNPTYAVWRD